MKLSDAIATVLCLAISFNLGKMGAFAMVFNGAVHDLCLVETMVRNEGAVSSPQLHFLTESSATIGIGKPFLLTLAGLFGQSFPLLRQLFRFNDGACWYLDGAIQGGDSPLVCHGTIEVPSFADVQQAIHFKLAGVGSALAHLTEKGLVPVGQRNSEVDGLEPVEGCVGVGGGELLDGVIDAGHGLKQRWKLSPPELPNNTAKGQERWPLADHCCLSLRAGRLSASHHDELLVREQGL